MQRILTLMTMLPRHQQPMGAPRISLTPWQPELSHLTHRGTQPMGAPRKSLAARQPMLSRPPHSRMQAMGAKRSLLHNRSPCGEAPDLQAGGHSWLGAFQPHPFTDQTMMMIMMTTTTITITVHPMQNKTMIMTARTVAAGHRKPPTSEAHTSKAAIVQRLKQVNRPTSEAHTRRETQPRSS